MTEEAKLFLASLAGADRIELDESIEVARQALSTLVDLSEGRGFEESDGYYKDIDDDIFIDERDFVHVFAHDRYSSRH